MQTLFMRGRNKAEASTPNPLPSNNVPQVVKAVYRAIPSEQVRAFIKKEVKPEPVTQKTYDRILSELHEVNPNEKIIWVGQSSQIMHAMAYICCILTGWLILPLIVAYLLYLQIKNTIYVLTNDRLRVYSGIFTKHIEDIELFRIKDTAYSQPFLYQFFGVSNIHLITSDAIWGKFDIPAIYDGIIVREKMRKAVQAARRSKGVREVDYFGQSPLSG